jgi:hypothetical protein
LSRECASYLRGIDIAIVWEDLSLYFRRPVFKPAGAIGQNPQPGKKEARIPGTLRQLVVQVKLGFDLPDSRHPFLRQSL